MLCENNGCHLCISFFLLVLAALSARSGCSGSITNLAEKVFHLQSRKQAVFCFFIVTFLLLLRGGVAQVLQDRTRIGAQQRRSRRRSHLRVSKGDGGLDQRDAPDGGML